MAFDLSQILIGKTAFCRRQSAVNTPKFAATKKGKNADTGSNHDEGSQLSWWLYVTHIRLTSYLPRKRLTLEKTGNKR